MSRPEVLTRYYTFTNTNPTEQDYEYLINSCNRINAYLVYNTIVVPGKTEGAVYISPRIRLQGRIVLPDGPTHLDDIVRLLPNFLVHQTTVRDDELFDFVKPNAGDIVYGRHPYRNLKKKLF